MNDYLLCGEFGEGSTTGFVLRRLRVLSAEVNSLKQRIYEKDCENGRLKREINSLKNKNENIDKNMLEFVLSVLKEKEEAFKKQIKDLEVSYNMCGDEYVPLLVQQEMEIKTRLQYIDDFIALTEGVNEC